MAGLRDGGKEVITLDRLATLLNLVAVVIDVVRAAAELILAVLISAQKRDDR